MRVIDVTYHREGGSWWAESSALPGFSALAADFASVRGLVEEAASADGAYVLVEQLEGLPLTPRSSWYDVSAMTSAPSALAAPRASRVFRELVEQPA